MWWFKLRNDDYLNPLYKTIARRSCQSIPVVMSVLNILRASASGAEDRGSLSEFDAESAGDALDVTQEAVEAVVQALVDKGWIANGRIADWEKTQPARDDSSKERTRQYRERKAATDAQAAAAAEAAGGPADRVEPRPRRLVTPSDALESEIDPEPEIHLEAKSPIKHIHARAGTQGAFEAFWEVWPDQKARRAAEEVFPAALKRAGGDVGVIVQGVKTYIDNKRPEQFWMNPARFLREDRFRDEPANHDEVDPMGWCYDPGDQLGGGRNMRRSEFEREYGKRSTIRKWRPATKEELSPKADTVWGKISFVRGSYERVDRAQFPNYDWDTDGVGHSRAAAADSPAGQERSAAIAAGKLVIAS